MISVTFMNKHNNCKTQFIEKFNTQFILFNIPSFEVFTEKMTLTGSQLNVYFIQE